MILTLGMEICIYDYTGSFSRMIIQLYQISLTRISIKEENTTEIVFMFRYSRSEEQFGYPSFSSMNYSVLGCKHAHNFVLFPHISHTCKQRFNKRRNVESLALVGVSHNHASNEVIQRV